MPDELKLQVGKVYVNRQGYIVYIVKQVHGQYQFKDEYGKSYLANGRYMTDGSLSENDLIKED